ncbi:hypothetical protein FRB99_005623 [Tulasnella sp. 403]|nr:hypothetical protein FRB99_005623 [Tulasnella sp. 403]
MSTGLDPILHRKPPSKSGQLASAPIKTLAWSLYRRSSFLSPNRLESLKDASSSPIRVVCIADVHNMQPTLPDGDLLILAGDITQTGTIEELREAVSWIRCQRHRYKVVVAGNHDVGLESEPRPSIDWGDVIYLENTTTMLDIRGRRVRVFGSPYTPKHGQGAFQYPRDRNVWSVSAPDADSPRNDLGSVASPPFLIPNDTDILVTHGPPRYHLDSAENGGHSGCIHLLEAINQLRPSLHVFGHIHAGHGAEKLFFDGFQTRYERIRSDEGDWRDLVRMFSSTRSHESAKTTTLVNAAIRKGYGLKELEQNDPIVVYM